VRPLKRLLNALRLSMTQFAVGDVVYRSPQFTLPSSPLDVVYRSQFAFYGCCLCSHFFGVLSTSFFLATKLETPSSRFVPHPIFCESYISFFTLPLTITFVFLFYLSVKSDFSNFNVNLSAKHTHENTWQNCAVSD